MAASEISRQLNITRKCQVILFWRKSEILCLQKLKDFKEGDDWRVRGLMKTCFAIRVFCVYVVSWFTHAATCSKVRVPLNIFQRDPVLWKLLKSQNSRCPFQKSFEIDKNIPIWTCRNFRNLCKSPEKWWNTDTRTARTGVTERARDDHSLKF